MPQDYQISQEFKVTFPAEYVAQVEIDRPKKLNAFTEKMFHDMGAIFNRLSSDPDVRAVILTANGDRAFSAGLDVSDASESGGITRGVDQDPARRAVALRRHILEIQKPVSSIEECEKPVIVVLHGISYGLAIDMSTCCDVRICTKDTRFSVREVNIGLAADVGTLSRLPQTGISMSFIKDVALSARDFSAQEALQVGFVSGVHEDKKAALEKALELAKLIASKSPVAVQGTKEVINFSRDHTVKDGLNYIAIWNAAMLQTQDVKDAMLSGLKKTKPKSSNHKSTFSAQQLQTKAPRGTQYQHLQVKSTSHHLTVAHNGLGRMYLVCEHKTNRQLVPNSINILDEEAIVMIISTNPDLRMVTKAIKPGCTCVDINKIDLVPDAEKAAYEKKLKASGKEEVPWKEFLGHEWEGHSFNELMILVPESVVPKLDDGKATHGDGEKKQ